ncbi:hypothetical protein EJB05_26957, partial [Eragrostis curvula]
MRGQPASQLAAHELRQLISSRQAAVHNAPVTNTAFPHGHKTPEISLLAAFAHETQSRATIIIWRLWLALFYNQLKRQLLQGAGSVAGRTLRQTMTPAWTSFLESARI